MMAIVVVVHDDGTKTEVLLDVNQLVLKAALETGPSGRWLGNSVDFITYSSGRGSKLADYKIVPPVTVDRVRHPLISMEVIR